MSARPFRSDRHLALLDTESQGYRLSHRPVRMPRQQKPLWVGSAGFWPRPHQMPVCWLLALVIALEIAALIYGIKTR